MNEQVKRYDYGYKDDGCGGARFLGLIEKPDGALVRHSDYAALEAECDKLRAQVSALQSDANSWQSGYDKGREDGAKAADGWKAQHARDSAELRRLCAERDALHAEAEALRAENGHWKGIHASSMALRMSAEFERDELRTELEAAQGLLRHIHATLSQRDMPYQYEVRDICSRIDALTNGENAPEVPDHFADSSKMV